MDGVRKERMFSHPLTRMSKPVYDGLPGATSMGTYSTLNDKTATSTSQSISWGSIFYMKATPFLWITLADSREFSPREPSCASFLRTQLGSYKTQFLVLHSTTSLSLHVYSIKAILTNWVANYQNTCIWRVGIALSMIKEINKDDYIWLTYNGMQMIQIASPGKSKSRIFSSLAQNNLFHTAWYYACLLRGKSWFSPCDLFTGVCAQTTAL